MPDYPRIAARSTRKDITDTFRGYHRAMKIGGGEFNDMKNMTSALYPMIASRKKRGKVRELSNPGGMLAKEKLAYVTDGKLFYDGRETALTGLSDGEKQLVSMGAYICIFPDKRYFNTADETDCGSMEAFYSSTGAVVGTMCRVDGSEYAVPTVGVAPPEEPGAMQLWIDTSGENDVLKQWSGENKNWVELPSVYTKLRFVSQGELPRLFNRLDGVKISGAQDERLNGSRIIEAIGGGDGVYDYIVVSGLIRETLNQTEGCITISRSVPDMDFVCECKNRLWGCRYGNDGEKNINEIYCCALGDFKNWEQFQGLSTDSWRASVGSDGAWTGAINYLGSPMFFKENVIHTVTVSSYGAHRVSETVCRGVQKGCRKSLAIVNETLYYKSKKDICAYQGGFPVGVSTALGDGVYYDAAAGTLGDKYYIAMSDENGERSLFVYDIGKHLWMKEDALNALFFAEYGGDLWCMTDEALFTMNGSEGEEERFVEWMLESGMLYYQYPVRKYMSRFNLRRFDFRLSMEEGAEMDIFIQYDSSGEWEHKGRIKLNGTGTVTVPVCPRRCDHLRLRLEGKGEFRLFSMARVLEAGSDV